MLRLFKNDNIATAVLLLLVAVLMRMAVWTGHVAVPEISGQSGLLYGEWCKGLQQRPLLSALLAMFLVIVQALWVNNLVLKFRMVRDRSMFFALFYIVFASVIPAFLYLSPALIATTFVCFSLGPLFSLYRSTSPAANIFDAVFFIVLASLFYPLAFWLLPAYLLGVAFIHSVQLKDLMVFVSAIFVPNFLAWGICFLRDDTASFWASSALLTPQLPQNLLQDGSQLSVFNFSLIVLVFFLVWVLLSFGGYFSRKLIQVQKYFSFLYWLLLFAVLSYFFQATPNLQHTLFFAPVMGVFLGHSFQFARNAVFAEVGLFLLIALGLLLQYWGLILPLI